ncbi:UxaA family hydrolase [Salinicola tamaricis]|uniref:UxaA family hydrolase n=1 Tax=Salinicola tamaricis TaxID=1771309 RepID=UPI000D0A6E18|nr:UxaA family hydrolase [Salinicola tamaricis]
MSIDFVVHDDDAVGVVVVEGVQAGQTPGWVMDQDKTLEFEVKDAIPIGHKLAIRDLAEGEAVIKYSVDIGRVVQSIRQGEHVHVHNVKTKRW